MSITFCIMQSCSTEEALMQNEAIIKTVSREQAIQFLQQNPLRTSSNKATKTSNSPNYDAITQEEISNSDQLLTVIPLANNYKTQHSRIVLLTINDTIKSAIVTMYPDDEQESKEFSGRVFISNLNGDFFKGFRMKNGYVISKFIKEPTSSTLRKSAHKTALVNDPEKPIQLKEVVVPLRKKVKSLTVAYLYVYSWEIDSSNNLEPDWAFGGGGGGGGAEPAAEEEDPCDQIKKQNSNTDYLYKIQSLEKKTSLKNETGFIENKDGTFKDLTNTTNDGLNVPKDVNIIGFNHTHIDDYESGDYAEDGNPIITQPIKIFSPNDVKIFLILLNNANRENLSLNSIYGKVISSANTYTLKFEGEISDINPNISFNRALDRNYKKAIKKNGLEAGFLKFLKENGIMGVSLYKINKDGTAEKKLLDINNTLTSTPCY